MRKFQLNYVTHNNRIIKDAWHAFYTWKCICFLIFCYEYYSFRFEMVTSVIGTPCGCSCGKSERIFWMSFNTWNCSSLKAHAINSEKLRLVAHKKWKQVRKRWKWTILNEEANMAYILTPSLPKAHYKDIRRLMVTSTLFSSSAKWQVTKMKWGKASPSLEVEANMPSWVLGPIPIL